jgi:LPXTG-motif cell wall-anchored protein
MHSALKKIAAGAAIATAFGAVTPVIAGQASAADATGTITVTQFEDRYADGLFDTTLVAANGDTDRKRTASYVYLHDVNGKWWATDYNASGDYVFPNIPVGAAQIYTGGPNSNPEAVFFDATGATGIADLERMPNEYVSFDNGTFILQNGTTIDTLAGPGRMQAEASVTVTQASQSKLIGMSAVRAGVETVLADDPETPVTGYGMPTVYSNEDSYEATESDRTPGSFFFLDGTSEAYFFPSRFGITVEPAEGYVVTNVEARSSVNTTLSAPVTETDGFYALDLLDAATFSDIVTFVVTLDVAPAPVEPPVTDPGTTTPPVLPGTGPAAGPGTAPVGGSAAGVRPGATGSTLAATGLDATASVAAAGALLAVGGFVLLRRRRTA